MLARPASRIYAWNLRRSLRMRRAVLARQESARLICEPTSHGGLSIEKNPGRHDFFGERTCWGLSFPAWRGPGDRAGAAPPPPGGAGPPPGLGGGVFRLP